MIEMQEELGSQSPKVSAVIITHNRPDYLLQAIEGVLQQTYLVDQIVIVDDGSSCDYASLVENIDHDNVKYIKHEIARGANAARNTGITNASNEILALLDDDDIWLADHVEKHIEKYRAGASAVVSGFKRMDSLAIRINEANEVTEEELRKGNYFCGMSGFSAKKIVLEKHQLDEALNNAQDWDLYIRICLVEPNFLNVSAPTFLYRVGTSDGITAKLKKMKVDDIDKRLGAAVKHRKWLGEKNYKRRVAEQVLSYINVKKQKAQWIAKCIKLIGVAETFSYFIEKVIVKRSDRK